MHFLSVSRTQIFLLLVACSVLGLKRSEGLPLPLLHTHFPLFLPTFVFVYSSVRAFITALYLKNERTKPFAIYQGCFHCCKTYFVLYAPLDCILHCFSLISAWRPHLLRTFSLLQAPIRIPRPRRIVRGLVRLHRGPSRIREVRMKTTTRCSKVECISECILTLKHQFTLERQEGNRMTFR